jgi:hypothetical protein
MTELLCPTPRWSFAAEESEEESTAAGANRSLISTTPTTGARRHPPWLRVTFALLRKDHEPPSGDVLSGETREAHVACPGTQSAACSRGWRRGIAFRGRTFQ